MVEAMVKFVRDLFTGPSNLYYDLGRVGLAFSLLSAVAYQGWALFQGQAFDALVFGTGCAAILGAGGFGIAQKDKARPKGLVEGEEIQR
jgi:hypothetical protein